MKGCTIIEALLLSFLILLAIHSCINDTSIPHELGSYVKEAKSEFRKGIK